MLIKPTLLSLLFLIITSILAAQEHPDLGLHGTVTWLDTARIRVEYDWTSDEQLLDWTTTEGSELVRNEGFVTVTGGTYNYVRSMIWKQGIRCSRISVQDVAAVTATASDPHINVYTNLASFTGSTWLPNPGLGVVIASTKNFWVHDGINAGNIGAPMIELGVARNYEYSASDTGMTIRSSMDGIVYSYKAQCFLEKESKIALGGWGGNTKWGKLIIEGEIIKPQQEPPVPSDVINIQSNGASFAPVIEVVGDPLIEWIFDDSTTSSSTTPVKDYGSVESRRNFLKVTPWSALIGINVGYDAADGGYGDFVKIPKQNVLEFNNLHLAGSLEYLLANYSLLTELDLRDLHVLKFVELFRAQSLSKIRLDSHPVLERLCVEDCNLDSLDISGCSGLKDLRGAQNSYTFINWGSVGQLLWHICIRDNPQIEVNIPDLIQFPLLKELLIWNTNQTGPFVCHNSVTRDITAYGNHYTSADISGCAALRIFALSGSRLSSINLGTAENLTDVKLRDCALSQLNADYVLKTLDNAGKLNGYLDITGNATPSVAALSHYYSLKAKGWTIEEITGIEPVPGNTGNVRMIVTGNEIRFEFFSDFTGWQVNLYDLYGKSISIKSVNDNILTFDTSSLSSGLYLVTLSNGAQRLIFKFIKP